MRTTTTTTPTTTRTLRALDFAFTLSTDDPALAGYVDEVFSSLAVEGEAAAGHYTAQSSASGYTLRLGDRLIASSAGAERVVTLLTWHVTQQALATMSGCVALHAAAAELDGGALLLPGRSGAGKSTLVAALVRRGLRYLTDEMAVLDGEPVRVRPFPKPLGIDGSPPAPLDDLASGPSPFTVEGLLVGPAALRPACLGAAAVPAWVIFPSYVGAEVPKLTPLRPAQALGLLGEHWMNPTDVGATGFEVLTGIARQARCWQLETGTLDATCDAVLALMSAG